MPEVIKINLKFRGNVIEEIKYRLLSKDKQIKGMEMDIAISDIEKFKDKVIKLNYVYRVDYVDVVRLSLKGELYFEGKDAQKVLKKWESTREITPEYNAFFMQTIHTYGSPLLITITSMLGLPPMITPLPIPMPEKKEKQKRTR